MAEVIELHKAKACGYDHYIIIVPLCDKDLSDRYVRESEYAALLERHKRLVAAASNYIGKGVDGTKASLDLWSKQLTELQAALAEEVDDGRDS